MHLLSPFPPFNASKTVFPVVSEPTSIDQVRVRRSGGRVVEVTPTDPGATEFKEFENDGWELLTMDAESDEDDTVLGVGGSEATSYRSVTLGSIT